MSGLGLNLQKGSLRHRIADQLKKAIYLGKLPPGERITEAQLADEFGVSRGPIREAIQQLEMEGLVTSLAYKETRVSVISKEEVIDLLLPIRINIEVYALKNAFHRFDDGQLTTFQGIVEEMRTAAAVEDLALLVELDMRFHEHLLGIAQLDSILKIWGGISNRIRLHFIYQGNAYQDLKKIVVDHEQLYQAYSSQDFKAAKKALEHHILDSNMEDLKML